MILIVSRQYSWKLAEAFGVSTVLTERAASYDHAGDLFWTPNYQFLACTGLYCGATLWYKKRLPAERSDDFVASAYRMLSTTATQVVRTTGADNPHISRRSTLYDHEHND
jgi:hypothetical protein